MISTMLLYVGAVLLINGLWFLGQVSERESLKISSKEIAVMNSFTGGLGTIIAIIAIARGGLSENVNITSIAIGGQTLLFAFTYLWVAINQISGADGRGLGWFCLFVAITAVPTGAVLLGSAAGTPWLTWLAINWLAWGVLWFMFFLLLALGKEITKPTAVVTLLEAVFTAWLPAWLLFEGYLQL